MRPVFPMGVPWHRKMTEKRGCVQLWHAPSLDDALLHSEARKSWACGFAGGCSPLYHKAWQPPRDVGELAAAAGGFCRGVIFG